MRVNGDLQVTRRLSSDLAFRFPFWTQAGVYTVDDFVLFGDTIYRCKQDHVAGIFSTDLTADRWQKVGGADQLDFFFDGNVVGDSAISLASDTIVWGAGDGIEFNVSNGSDYVLVTANPMVGATPTVEGTKGAVPAPAAGDDDKFLRGDGQWAEVTASDFSGVGLSGLLASERGLVPAAPNGTSPSAYLAASGEWTESPAGYTNVQVASVAGGESAEFGTEEASNLLLDAGEGLQIWGLGGNPGNATRTIQISPVAFKGTGDAQQKMGAVPAPDPTYDASWLLSATGDWVQVSVGEMSGQLGSMDGAGGSVPAPLGATRDGGWFLKGDGTWSGPGARFGKEGGSLLDASNVEVNSIASSPFRDIDFRAGTGIQIQRRNGGTLAGREMGPQVVLRVTDFTGASPQVAGGNSGSAGGVPAPAVGDGDMFLRGDAMWVPAVEGLRISAAGGSISGAETTVNPQYFAADDNLLKVAAGDGVDLNSNGSVLTISAPGIMKWSGATQYYTGQLYSIRDLTRGLDTICRVLVDHISEANNTTQANDILNGNVERVSSGPIQAFYKTNNGALMNLPMGEIRVTGDFSTIGTVQLPVPPAIMPQFGFCRITLIDVSGNASNGARVQASGSASFADGSQFFDLPTDYGSWIFTFHHDPITGNNWWSTV